MGKDNIKKKFSSFLDLPKEAIYNLPYITISGKDELSIENFKGIVEYSDNLIRINTSLGILKIEGENFLLKQVAEEIIVLNGLIKKLEYIS